MSGAHHLFAPSGAHRWMVCGPALAVSQQYPESTSYEAAEGTVAHRMASTCLETGFDAVDVWKGVEMASEDGHEIPITDEMREHVQSYLDYVRGIEGGMEVERRLEFRADPDFGGTADVLVWDIVNNVLHVIDFKYGKGILVKAERNKQMMCYALLALAQPDNLIEPEMISLHVHQPRRDNVSRWDCPADDLVPFSTDVGRAMMNARRFSLVHEPLLIPEAEFTPGEHCTFCPHSANCHALRNKSILNAQMVFGDVTEVPTPSLEEILVQADMIDTWIGAVRKEAMDRALKGEPFKHHKLVQKRPMRKWVNIAKVEEVALDALVEIHEKVVLTPPALGKIIGEKQLNFIFGDLVQSVSSGLTLVSVDDKRPAVDPKTAAAEKAMAVFTDLTQST